MNIIKTATMSALFMTVAFGQSPTTVTFGIVGSFSPAFEFNDYTIASEGSGTINIVHSRDARYRFRCDWGFTKRHRDGEGKRVPGTVTYIAPETKNGLVDRCRIRGHVKSNRKRFTDETYIKVLPAGQRDSSGFEIIPVEKIMDEAFDIVLEGDENITYIREDYTFPEDPMVGHYRFENKVRLERKRSQDEIGQEYEITRVVNGVEIDENCTKPITLTIDSVHVIAPEIDGGCNIIDVEGSKVDAPLVLSEGLLWGSRFNDIDIDFYPGHQPFLHKVKAEEIVVNNNVTIAGLRAESITFNSDQFIQSQDINTHSLNINGSVKFQNITVGEGGLHIETDKPVSITRSIIRSCIPNEIDISNSIIVCDDKVGSSDALFEYSNRIYLSVRHYGSHGFGHVDYLKKRVGPIGARLSPTGE